MVLNQRFRETGIQPDEYQIDLTAKFPAFTPAATIDPDDYSDQEIDAMCRAWDYFIPLLSQRQGFRRVEQLFHETGFPGKAWSKARAEGRAK